MAGRRRARGRKLNGILVLDKPAGMTSNEALQKVKQLYQAQKAGHTGSLDKPARGVLPLCFGEATKLSGFLLDSDKEYQASCRLGITTSTGDAAGEVIGEKAVPEFTTAAIERVLEGFRGDIMQVPPMHSALKHKGERLYKLAYQGIEVERQARPVTISELQLLKLEKEMFDIHVRCSKGTYIRTLVEDIGRELGPGAHVAALQRTAAGPFDQAVMHSMQDIEAAAEQGQAALDALLLPAERAVADLPRVDLASSVAYYLLQGQPVMVPRAPTGGIVRLYSEAEKFLGIGEILEDGRVAPRRILNLSGA